MTTTRSLESAEDLLRTTLAVRAEDMAPGDLGRRPLGPVRLVVVPPARPDALPAEGRRRRPTTGWRRRPLVAAAVVVLAAGVAVATWDRDGRGRVSSGTGTTAPPDTPGTSPDTGLDGLHERITWSYSIGWYAGDGHTMTAEYQADASRGELEEDRTWERLQVGDHVGYYRALPDGSVSELRLVVEGGLVTLGTGSLPREQLIAAGATVTLDPETRLYTMPAPPGWTTLEGTPDSAMPRGGPDGDNATPRPLGQVTDPAAPDVRSAWVTWNPDWELADLGEPAEPPERLDIGGREAYLHENLSSIDVDDHLHDSDHLTIVFDDGVIDMNAIGLTRDELLRVAEGIREGDGVDEIEVEAPPGFEWNEN
jgi:hypothetical protein